jgi:hypothetical protein
MNSLSENSKRISFLAVGLLVLGYTWHRLSKKNIEAQLLRLTRHVHQLPKDQYKNTEWLDTSKSYTQDFFKGWGSHLAAEEDKEAPFMIMSTSLEKSLI